MASNYVLLERIELNASASSVTFSNIPQTGYTDLKLVVSARGNYADIYDVMAIKFNGSSSGYSGKYIQSTGSSASSGNQAPSTYIELLVGGSTSTSDTFCNTEVHIPNYTSSNQKSVSADDALETNATTVYSRVYAGLWTGTSAITQIEVGLGTAFGTAYLANSTFSLYGLAAVGTEPAIAPKASGGNIQTDGTYWYHTFFSSGAFVPATPLSCDYLVVAGGGGGGAASGSATAGYGGGGGAGGYRSATGQSLAAQSYAITIGAGGAKNTNGVDSSIAGTGFTTFTSTGGGFGGNKYYVGRSALYDGANGGSGGGAGNNVSNLGGLGNTPSTSPSQGNSGGIGYVGGGNAAGSGGGGAGAAGSQGTNNGSGGAGGAGSNSLSSWASVTNTGVAGYYAGGGGGGVENDTYTGGAGGAGGGGRGDGSGQDSTAGTTNTGGGGGGGGDNTAKSGGSGIVIIRYAV